MIEPYIIPIRAGQTAAIEIVGGKAHNLLRLAGAGMPVPGGFVITTVAHRAWAAAQGELPANLEAEFRRAYDALGPNCPVAVRSSGTSEDSKHASFAGEHETLLGVSGPDAVRDAIRTCWASLEGDRARAYRARMGVSEEGLAIAIIVQRMVRARTSGVVFTVEPVSANRNRLAIDACAGLGEALVSGRVTPERYELRRQDLKIVKQENRAGNLSKAEVRRVAKCALEIERYFGCPQDVEWSIDMDGELHILQARPITTVQDGNIWESPVPGAIWVRRGSGGLPEYLPTALSPLYATAQLPRIVKLLDAQCPEMGVVTPEPTAALINGHYYSRQDYKLSLGALRLPMNYWRAGRRGAARWKQEVLPAQTAALAALQALDHTGATDLGLLAHLNRILDFNAVAWDNAVRASRAWVVLEPVFKRIFQWFVRPVSGGEAVAFLRGFDSRVLAAEAEQGKLVQAALATPAVCRILREYESEPAFLQLQEIREGCQWIGRLLGFCERYGHMTANQDYLWPTAADDPVRALAAVRARLDLPVPDLLQRQQRVIAERHQAEREAFEKLLRRPLRRAIFAWALEWAQEGASIREDVFFHALSGWPLARRTMLELGKRFAQRGLLDSASQVFFLEWSELVSLCNGNAHEDYSHSVKDRIATLARQAELSPPPSIPPGGPPRTLSRRLKDVLKRMVVGSTRENRRGFLRGAPASPGRVTGPARILASIAEIRRLQAGEVIVTRAATPEWTPTFAVAAGLVTDTGGPLSHCSIIAREFGIPAVMGVPAATLRIMNGQMITVDGSEGLVQLHAEGASL